MAAPRLRRRLVALVVLGSLGAALALYRRRELTRNAQEFDARYG